MTSLASMEDFAEIITMLLIIAVLYQIYRLKCSEGFIPGDPFGISLSRYTFNDNVGTGPGSNAYLSPGSLPGKAYRDMTGLGISAAMM